MQTLEYILKIIIYFIFAFSIYYLCEKNKKNVSDKKRISIRNILILSTLMGIYSIICTSYPYGGDRENYAILFKNDIHMQSVKEESLGLYIIQSILHVFTHDPQVLFFTCAFLYLFFTLIAYNEAKDIKPISMLLIGISSYLIFGFYMLKQSLAVALFSVAFAYYTQDKKKIAVLFFILSMCFHQSALIMIPILIVLKLLKNKKIAIGVYVLSILGVIFFKQINSQLINIAIKIIPSLKSQLSLYLNDKGSLIFDYNYFTILKGIPFYFLFGFLLYKRKELKNKIKNYDEYLFLIFVISITILLSFYMYWMFRFGIFCYFPVFLFVSLVLEKLTLKKDKIILKIIFEGSLFALTLRLWCQYYFLYGGI